MGSEMLILSKQLHLRSPALVVSAVTVVIFLFLALWISAHQFLDDAFIHLRISANLAEKGIFSFNGEAPHFSTSSPLYTSVLAMFWSIIETPLLPKIVNVAIYLCALFCVLGPALWAKSDLTRGFLMAAALLMVTPFSLRWMTDGMETGSVAFAAMLLALATDRLKKSSGPDAFLLTAVSFLSFFSVLLRIEFSFVVALSGAALFAYSMSSTKNLGSGIKCASWKVAPLVLGGCAALLVIFLVFGQIFPDTALAKRGTGALDLIGTFNAVATAHAAASLFGIGSPILLLSSFIVAFRLSGYPERMYLLSANFGLFLFFLLLASTHQALQGMRYFVFLETFLIALNVLALPAPGVRYRSFVISAITKRLIAALLSFWFLVDAALFFQISHGRTQSYEQFVKGDYEYLKGQKGIAWDVGMVGFFTQGYILDPKGLVNGRFVASIPGGERLKLFSRENVVFAFVNEPQRNVLNKFIDTSSWRSVGQFDFPNVGPGRDTHYLIVNPSAIPHE